MKVSTVKATLPTKKANGDIVGLLDGMPNIRVIRKDLAAAFKVGIEMPILSAGAARDRDALVREAGGYEFATYNAAAESRGGKVRDPESARSNVERYLRTFASNVTGVPENMRITVSVVTLDETREYNAGNEKQDDGWVMFYLSPA